MAFCQICWEIIKKDVKKFFVKSHSFVKFDKNLNATFISIIPKKAKSVEVRYFHISLVCGVYKIIFKVLANCINIGYREDYFKTTERFC